MTTLLIKRGHFADEGWTVYIDRMWSVGMFFATAEAAERVADAIAAEKRAEGTAVTITKEAS